MWTDVMNLKVTEYNSTKAHILIGFWYPSQDYFPGEVIAHAYQPGLSDEQGDIHIRADKTYSAFSSQGREFKMHGLFKVVCLSMCLCLLCLSVCVYVCVSVCVSFR